MQIKSLKHLALSFWFSPNSLQAWVLTLLVALCTVIIVLLTMVLNKWQAGFYNHLLQYNYAGFVDNLTEFLGFSGILVFTSGYQSYCRMLLGLRWRHWLTNKYIGLWLHNQTYYQLNLAGYSSNPEQRISEDVNLFITNTLDLAVGLLRHTVMLLVFSVVLWQMSGMLIFTVLERTLAVPGYLFWLSLFYSLIGTLLIIRVGRPLIARNVIQQTNEAEFRSHLARIKDHDECVALYSGEAMEKLNLTNQFQKIIRNYLYITESTKKVTVVSSAYSQLSIVFAFLAAAPRYFNGEIQLGQLFEISGAYWYVHSALSYIIDSFGKFALWKAVASRLQSFSAHITTVRRLSRPQGVITVTQNNQLKINDLTVSSQANQPLLKHLTLDVNPGDKLLISGPTGSGKSTLLKTIAGIWPYFTGSICKPDTQSVMFLPQKPYIPPSTLREALQYPNCGKSAPDTYLHTVLENCSLGNLIGQLDRINDWGKSLSLGEQQCLSFGRVMLQRPFWLFLDEATSSLDKQTEYRLYLLLANTLPDLTFISVGHRHTLRQFHTSNLTLDGLGDWQVAPIENNQVRSLKITGIVV